MPAPPPPAEKQVSNEAREIPPQHQEETSSGKSTSGERSEEINASAPSSSHKAPTKSGQNDDGWKKQRGRQKGRSRKSSPSSPSSRAKSCHSFGAGKERSRSPVKPP